MNYLNKDALAEVGGRDMEIFMLVVQTTGSRIDGLFQYSSIGADENYLFGN